VAQEEGVVIVALVVREIPQAHLPFKGMLEA
jgi:hypothetical protein